jgi:hypothetical protein
VHNGIALQAFDVINQLSVCPFLLRKSVLHGIWDKLTMLPSKSKENNKIDKSHFKNRQIPFVKTQIGTNPPDGVELPALLIGQFEARVISKEYSAGMERFCCA